MSSQPIPPVLSFPPPALSPPPVPGWWRRNGKWAIPLICVGGLAAFAGIFALFFALLFGFMKSSDAYKDALVRAELNPAVLSALGAPVKAGLVFTGHIQVSGPSGRAELAIPLSGPKGKGTLYVKAMKSAGEWRFSLLVLKLDATGENIDLLEKHGQADPAAGANYF